LWFLQVKMEGLYHEQMFLLISTQHDSTQTVHLQVILDKYTNGDGVYIIFILHFTFGYGLDVRGVGIRVLVGSRIFSSPHRPYRL
jgi:hypothetical protein